MLFQNRSIKYLAGNTNIKNSVNKIFDENICNFLSTLSEKILSEKQAYKYVDLITFAFWIRKKNLNKLKNKYTNGEIRLGYGLAFHIAPANIALNFAYSFAYSLLSGNSNIVRVPSAKYEQNKIFFKIMNLLFKIKKFKKIKDSNLFISYERNDNITKEIIFNCDYKIVWGSDQTIKNINQFETKSTCKELIFPDRYSISIINLKSLSKLNRDGLKKLAQKFYLDSYLFDQNACSSPHLVIWYGKKNLNNHVKFWDELDLSVRNGKYFNLNEKNKFDKYEKFCEFSVTIPEIISSYNHDFVSRMKLKRLPKNIHNLRVGNGFFFEYFINDLKILDKFITPKIQTLTYFGFKKNELEKFIYLNKPNGIDRIVPIGRALEFNEVWDGYDLVRNLSKLIDLR